MSAWLEKTSERIAKWLVTKPRQVAVTLVVMMLAGVAALPLMKVESGSATFITDDDPAQKFLKVIEREFVSDDVVFVAYEADDPFAKATLEEIRVISDEFAQIGDGLVDEVVSLTTVKDVRGANSTFRSVLRVPEDVPSDPAGVLAVFGSLTRLSTILTPMLMVLPVAHFLTEYARNTQVVGVERAAEVSLRELLVPAFSSPLWRLASNVQTLTGARSCDAHGSVQRTAARAPRRRGERARL